MSELEKSAAVGELATSHPSAMKIFERHGIDFCCGGTKSLSEACAERGLDAQAIIDEIRKQQASAQASTERWDQKPVPELIDHILSVYHVGLKEDLPRLEAMARKVLEVHGPKDPKMFSDLLATVLALKADLVQHLMKEERILFPMILSGAGAMAAPPIGVMRSEHDTAGAMLRRIRELTHDFVVPAEACATWRGLWQGLEQLEQSLHEHIHLENNILFPRVLGE
jgi:regulator of cell morphogenesis and NO signaling